MKSTVKTEEFQHLRASAQEGQNDIMEVETVVSNDGVDKTRVSEFTIDLKLGMETKI